MTAETFPVQQDSRSFWRSFMKGIKANWLMYLLFVVLVMALAAIFVAISGLARTNEQNVQLKRLVECQNSYNEINNERTRQLSEATTRERATQFAADIALFDVVEAANSGNSEKARKAMIVLREKLDQQATARAALDRERQEHPVPPPPKALCGNVP